MTHLYVEHEFKPVGQGLFAFGSLEFKHIPKGRRKINTRRPPDWDFTWVYDCGTSSGQALVDRGIREIAAKVNGKLDLIVISHLHHDHISGLLRLLNEVGTQTIMFPWAPLWQRLLIGFDQGLTNEDRAMDFYIDPVGYLADEAGDTFDRVLFVLPSRGGDASDPDEPVPGIDPEDLGPREDRKFPRGSTSGQLEVPDIYENRRSAQVLSAGERLIRGGAWEFVPYNDPESAPKSAGALKKSVSNLSPILLGPDEDRRKDALSALKKLYKREFPAGYQNDLSLNLYGGPVPLSKCIPEPVADPATGQVSIPDNRAPLLYTGDANYSTKARWNRMSKYFGSKRVNAVRTFQVPHHGSKKNWKSGLASLISPTHSVFSSDPSGGYNHPDADVWREFLPYNPIQVDKHSGFPWKDQFKLPGK
jgi:hypothetical protein